MLKKDYIVDEADNLVAGNTVIKDPLPLSNGIEKVMKCIEDSKL